MDAGGSVEGATEGEEIESVSLVSSKVEADSVAVVGKEEEAVGPGVGLGVSMRWGERTPRGRIWGASVEVPCGDGCLSREDKGAAPGGAGASEST